jgi:putative endonuclease
LGANSELKLGKSPGATAYTLSPFVPAQAGTQESEAVSFWVYILASRRNGTLYIGMTDLVRRSWEHRTGAVPGFTRKYGVKMLVWFEQHETRESALQREQQLKKWNRAWKLQLIERFNPSWKDLADELTP